MTIINYEGEIKNLKILVQNLKQENERLYNSKKENSEEESIQKLKEDMRKIGDVNKKLILHNKELNENLGVKRLEIEELKVSNLRELEKRVIKYF